MKRRKPDRCGTCHGTKLVKAVDNHGEEYLGCARCVIVLPADAEQGMRTCEVCAGEREGMR